MRIALAKSLIATAATLAVGAAAAADLPGPVSGMGDWERTLQARDLDNDGIVDAYYDSGLNISWLANANALANPDEGFNGQVSFDDAVAWASSLNVAGITGWHLPTINISNCSTGWGVNFWNGEANPAHFAGAGVGGGVCGYNVQTDTSDMAHMFMVTLGNESISGTDNGTLTNTGPFSNLQGYGYWFSLDHYLNDDGKENESEAWRYSFNAGRQDPMPKTELLHAWAVYDGDIGKVGMLAPVPEPETYTMMLAGLGAMALVARRRRRNGN